MTNTCVVRCCWFCVCVSVLFWSSWWLVWWYVSLCIVLFLVITVIPFNVSFIKRNVFTQSFFRFSFHFCKPFDTCFLLLLLWLNHRFTVVIQHRTSFLVIMAMDIGEIIKIYLYRTNMLSFSWFLTLLY